MGLLDKMFGGGTNLELRLDTEKIPEGGTLSGTVSLSGAKPEHIQALSSMAADPAVSADRRLMHELIAVAAKFAEEGAGPLVHWFAQHPNPEVRQELFMRACDDPDEEVAQDALKGMGRLLGFDAAVPFYRQRMAARPIESTSWAVYYGICNDLEEPAARALMQELTRAHFADVASSARDALEGA